MPWKTGYTTSDECSHADDSLRWPNDHRAAFNVTVDLDPLCGPDGVVPESFQTPEAYYGMHRGLDAVRSVLDKSKIRATFALSAVTAECFPRVVEILAKEGHEIATTGLLRENVETLDPEEEASRVDLVTKKMSEMLGQAPQGWLALPRVVDRYAVGGISTATARLLKDAGYAYMGGGLADDIPYYHVIDTDMPNALLTLPYYYHYDDQFFLMFPAKGTGLEHSDVLERNWKRQLDAQTKRHRCTSIVVHPYLIGWGHRLTMFGDLLALVAGTDGVWAATSEDIAAYWTTEYPTNKTLNLKPSIWQDYPDSLS